jgi:hypothetical protein
MISHKIHYILGQNGFRESARRVVREIYAHALPMDPDPTSARVRAHAQDIFVKKDVAKLI